MVIRPGGYNTGAQEYLETGNKAGRELHRDELDFRMIIEGDLDRTRAIYESIPDHGQDRYLTFTMSFREDQLDEDVLRSITQEFKQFLMHAYKADEFNFYAEAHLPKLKYVPDKKTGEMIERKPHIHIIVPRINLLSGNEANPVDIYMNHVKFYEAFQEYINQKYNLASPRDHIRVDITDAASVLSRYKADDFYGKNREFKQALVKQVIERGITDREGFYALVGESGETRIRNEGKETEYIAVKLQGDAKFTNLKDTIFRDDFIVRRELKMPPLEDKVIHDRLQAWPQRAKEIKYVNKATPKFRKAYSDASPEDRVRLLADREAKFYQTYGDNNVRLHPGKRPRDHQRGLDETQGRSTSGPADGMQNVPLGNVANHGQAGQTRDSDGTVLLPSDAHVHLGQHQPGGDIGLRPPVPGGRGGAERESFSGSGGRKRPSAVSASKAGTGKAGTPGRGTQTGDRSRITDNPLPPHARNPRRMATMADIRSRGSRLFDPLKRPVAPDTAFELDMNKLFIPEPRGPNDQAKASGARKKANYRGQRTAGTFNPRKASIAQKRPSDPPLPPFARNPHRVPTVADIQRHGQRLFEPSKRRSGPLEIKLTSIKSLTANRSASTVAAYFRRQAEQQLAPAQRHALRRLNRQYFELRRSVFSDRRLTRQDKSQLVSVLAFERLKATEQIRYSPFTKEVHLMGSAEIRKLIVDEPENPDFSISGPRGAAPVGVRDRVKRILDKLSEQLDPGTTQARARELAAKDIYTRKAKFSQNVHYLDKLTDKTLFVDTGTAIAMRRNGITESGVAVALQLAKERFGSTLTINGTAEFKRLVVEAAAKSGLDLHFTDKGMNESLAARRTELEIAKEDQSIQPAASAAAAPKAEIASTQSPVATAAKANTLDIVVTGKAVVVDLDDPLQVEAVGRQLDFQVNALGDRINVLDLQVASYKQRQDMVPLPLLSDLSPEAESAEAIVLQRVGLEGKPAPVNILPDVHRLGWYRTGLEIRVEHLQQTIERYAGTVGYDRTADEQALASTAVLIDQVDANVATATRVGPPTAINAPWGETMDALNSKIDRAVKEQTQARTLKNQAEQTLKLLGTATAGKSAAATPLPTTAPSEAARSPSELVMRESAWRKSMQMNENSVLTEAEVLSSDTVMGLRGEDHAIWLVATGDQTPEAVAMLRTYMENPVYRDAFKSTLEDFYSKSQHSADALSSLDASTNIAVAIVNEVESRQSPVAETRKVIRGELIAHGAAPYQHQADKQESYFVTVKTDAGERTVWGVGLAQAMQASGMQKGELLRLEDLGTQPVLVQEIGPDGKVTEKTTHRREWAAERTAPERQEAQVAPSSAPASPTSEDEPGMSQD